MDPDVNRIEEQRPKKRLNKFERANLIQLSGPQIAELVPIIFSSLCRFDRRIWGNRLERQISTRGSRFVRAWMDNRGPIYAAEVVVSYYWSQVSAVPWIVMILIGFAFSQDRSMHQHNLVIAAVLCCSGVGLLCLAVSFYHLKKAKKAGRKYRDDRTG